MNNPFIKDGAIMPNASINNVYIKKMPVYTITENLEGKYAGDIFSTDLVIEEIKKKHNELGLDLTKLDERKLPQYLSECLKSNIKTVKETAEEITELFGNRLGIILLVLKTGLNENKKSRDNWENDHWIYWSNIKNVFLTGGLAGGNLGAKFKYYIEKLFIENHISPFNIILKSDSENTAIKGCTTYIDSPIKNTNYLVLDCGATFIKRSFVKFDNNENLNITKLNKVPSKFVRWNYNTDEEEREEAFKMHDYIIDVITDSLNSIVLTDGKNVHIGNTIVISIANYVNHGKLIKRGAYGKLRFISDNYEEFLSHQLYEKLNKDLKIKLIHDGTAMASAFNGYEQSVCISLGTHFGVGFPAKSN